MLSVLVIAVPGASAGKVAAKYTIAFSGTTSITTTRADDQTNPNGCVGTVTDTASTTQSAAFKPAPGSRPTPLSGNQQSATANPEEVFSGAKASWSVSETGSIKPPQFSPEQECRLESPRQGTCKPGNAKPGRANDFELRTKGGKLTIRRGESGGLFFTPCLAEQEGREMLDELVTTKITVGRVRGLGVGGKVTESRTVTKSEGKGAGTGHSSSRKETVHYTLTIKRVS